MESPGFPEAKAYLSCVCQLAKEGCPSQEALDGLSEAYKLAFRRYGIVVSHSLINPYWNLLGDFFRGNKNGNCSVFRGGGWHKFVSEV